MTIPPIDLLESMSLTIHLTWSDYSVKRKEHESKNQVCWLVAYLCMYAFLIYLFFRQREIMNGGGSDRDGDTESETGSRF